MAASVNVIYLIGRLGRDPEAFHIGQDTLARFNIATDDGYKSSDGQRGERVTWHTVTAHGATADFCLKYLHKGELVYVQGAYISRKYRTKDGRDAVAWGVSASRVQFLDGSERGAQNRNCHDHQQGGYDDDWRN